MQIVGASVRVLLGCSLSWSRHWASGQLHEQVEQKTWALLAALKRSRLEKLGESARDTRQGQFPSSSLCDPFARSRRYDFEDLQVLAKLPDASFHPAPLSACVCDKRDKNERTLARRRWLNYDRTPGASNYEFNISRNARGYCFENSALSAKLFQASRHQLRLESCRPAVGFEKRERFFETCVLWFAYRRAH